LKSTQQQPISKLRRRIGLTLFIVLFVTPIVLFLSVLTFGFLGWLLTSEHEEIARFELPQNRTLVVYAVGKFHYDPTPPANGGSIYVSLLDAGKTVVNKRKFLWYQHSRVPPLDFDCKYTADVDVVSVTWSNDIFMMYRFSDDTFWEPSGLNEQKAEIGNRLLEQLQTDHPRVGSKEISRFFAERTTSTDGS